MIENFQLLDSYHEIPHNSKHKEYPHAVFSSEPARALSSRLRALSARPCFCAGLSGRVGLAGLPAGWNFGEVAGVAVDARGHVLVFHRGPHPIIEFESGG